MRLFQRLPMLFIIFNISVFNILAQSPKGYIILTTNEIYNNSTQIDNFITHKHNKGFNVLVATESTWGGGVGDVAAENIRIWLKNQYLNNYEDLRPVYVLLIGDPNPYTSQVPMKITPPSLFQFRVPTDFYYADISSNWDQNNNGKFCEFLTDYIPFNPEAGAVFDNPSENDFMAELQVGRIPYYGVMADLDKILQKIMHYENETNIAWRKKVLLPMEPITDKISSCTVGEKIKDDILFPKQWKYYRVYDNINSYTGQGIYHASRPEAIPCNIPNVIRGWMTFIPGLVVWLTHGSNTSAADVLNSEYSRDFDGILYPAMVFSASCYNARPEADNNLAYSQLLYGAIATIAFTSVGCYTPYLGEGMYFGRPDALGMLYDLTKYVVGDGLELGKALNIRRELPIYIDDGTSGQLINFLSANIYGCPDATLGFPKPTSAPTNLGTHTLTSEAVYLSWADNSNDETAFCIEYRIAGETTWIGYG